MTTATLKRKQPTLFHPHSSLSERKYTYDEIVTRAMEQDRLITEGLIDKPRRIIRAFTSEEQIEFDNGVSIQEYIKARNKVPL